jgi:ribosomal protein S18 acetylase RimI-like enzyme
MSMPEGVFVRQGQQGDRAALFDICLRTADTGADATALYSDPDYPGQVWSVPYLELAPQHCFVLDSGGEAVGYVVGAADTMAFEARLEREWWPALRSRYADRQPAAPFDGKVLDAIRTPESEAELAQRYPAHLHINLLPAFQSGGWGRKLIEVELDSLRRAGAPAVFLGVGITNTRAIGFYAHVGFMPVDGPTNAVWLAQQL